MPDNTDIERTVVRFAPSPTGNLHIGSARTALFNYLFAEKHGGHFVLRLEDTDIERSKKEFEDNILEGLEWLGISHDEYIRQSDRTNIYEDAIQRLLGLGSAYVSEEESGERKSVIRFKNPNTTVSFTDLVRGEIEFDTTDLGDFVIAKGPSEPLYNLAVVVDDFDMGITHVIRGEDHISNTPRQILILEALGADRPEYAHIPMILAPDRSKLSKRHGAVSLIEYQREGYNPAALVNYLALLGWNPGGDEEVFDLPELIEQFDIAKIQKGGAIFSEEKLRWFHSEHEKRRDIADRCRDLRAHVKGRSDISKEQKELLEKSDAYARVLLEREPLVSRAGEAIASGDYHYLVKTPIVEGDLLLFKDTPKEEIIEHLEWVQEALDALDDFSPEAVKEAVWDYATREGRGAVLSPLRLALSGEKQSLDPFSIAAIIGKEETRSRIERALDTLKR